MRLLYSKMRRRVVWYMYAVTSDERAVSQFGIEHESPRYQKGHILIHLLHTAKLYDSFCMRLRGLRIQGVLHPVFLVAITRD